MKATIANTDEMCDETNDNSSSLSANPGWADVLQKILRTNKPKKKKTLILSRAKKLQDVHKEKATDETSASEIPGSETKPGSSDHEAQSHKEQARPRRRGPSLGIRVKPSITDRERERMLQKIATKGVVQLFNAVKQQQADIEKKIREAGPLERKRERVLKDIDKRAFLDVLMGDTKSIPVDDNTKNEQNNNADNPEQKVWSVLRDEFVMGAKLKDWDKKDNESEEDSSAPEEMDSDN